MQVYCANLNPQNYYLYLLMYAKTKSNRTYFLDKNFYIKTLYHIIK